jgi:uridylate kinase
MLRRVLLRLPLLVSGGGKVDPGFSTQKLKLIRASPTNFEKLTSKELNLKSC